MTAGKMDSIALQDGSKLQADQYVFACGPGWAACFGPSEGFDPADTAGSFFFGVPAETRASPTPRCRSGWITGPSLIYGIPGNEFRGFKIADDARGAPFDPTSGETRRFEGRGSMRCGSSWPAGFRNERRAAGGIKSLPVRGKPRWPFCDRPAS